MNRFSELSRQTRAWYAAQSRRNRILIWVALSLLMLQFFRLGWGTLSGYAQELEQRIEIREMEYRNLTRMISRGQEYERLAEEVRQFEERLAQERLVKAASPPLSEAMFQNIVNELADRHQITVVSLRMLPRAERDGVTLLRLGISGRAEIGALRDFLVAVEYDARMMFFEEVEVKLINQRERRYFNFNAQLAAVNES